MNHFVYALLFFALLSQFGHSQDIRFKHLNINDGLSQNAVFAISQDAQGFMWFGTKDGLNKYDGQKFTYYTHDPNNENSIDHNQIKCIYTDPNGIIWVGTLNGQLNKYNPNTDSFERFKLPQSDLMSSNNAEIKVITSDLSNNLWVGTSDNGLFKVPVINGRLVTEKVIHYKHLTNDNHSISDNTVRNIFIDNNETIWLATKKGLNKLDATSHTFTQYLFNVKNPKAPKSDTDFAVLSVVNDGTNKLWLGTNSGLIHFDPQTENYDFFPHHYSVYRYGWGEITEIKRDKNGDLWLATTGELMQFDTKSKTYIRHLNDPFNPQSLSFNSISSLYIDNTEQLWVGTNGLGINIYDPKSHRFSLIERKKVAGSRITGFSIRSICKESDRYLWIGSDVTYLFDLETKELKSFEKSSDSLNAFGNTGAWSIIKGSDGLMWFATTEGLYSYQTSTKTHTQYKHDAQNLNSLPQKNVGTVFEDNQKYLWVLSENYLSKLVNKKTGEFIHFRYNSNSETNRYIRPVIYELNPGNLLLGTSNGLLIFNEKLNSFHTIKNEPKNPKSLINNDIKCITPDPINPEEYLWIGTSGGLSKFNIKEQTFDNYTIHDGLPNNVIYGVLTDHLNNLWVSTNKGLSKFNPKDKTFRNFDINDGLQSNEFNTGAYYKSSTGEMFFGGIKGITHFFPELIKENHYIPKTAITKITVTRKSDEDNPYVNEQINPHSSNLIEFSHYDKVITFEFASLDFSATQKNQYAYKLEGFNDTWIENNNLNTASFTNLPPGKYTLQVKSSNNDGIWNETGASLSFKVKPHWSGTWWAYSIYFTMLLLALYLIRKYELTRFQIKNQLKYERLESETLRELDQLKSRFFTNISHEFRTPLTIIKGQTEQLLKEIQNQGTQKKLQDIQLNSNRLLELINQLLDVAKLESGKMPLKKTSLELNSYIKNLFYSFESLAIEKSIQLSFQSPNEEIWIETDAEHLQKILYNILSNALKFTPESGKVEFRLFYKNDHQIGMEISDSGIGISQKDIPHIFNRFYQADYSDTRPYEGTGIGLALAKELSGILSGKLSVKNNKNKPGTTFTLLIPIGNPNKTTSTFEKFKLSSHNQTVNGNTFYLLPDNEKLILVVEDNQQVRSFIIEQLKNHYKVLEAQNGQLGIELAQKHIPDLILTDVMMPIVDGYNLVKQLKDDEKTSHIPVIMLTGKVSHEDKIKGLVSGVDAYLNKPFHTDELRLVITNLLHKQEQLKKKFSERSFLEIDAFDGPSVDRAFLEKVNNQLQNNYPNTAFTVEILAEKLCLSSSQLHRKLQALTGQAPGEWIRKFRLLKAAELLKNNTASVAEICYNVGFNDPAYFSRAFKNEFGCSPSAYKKEMA